MQSVVLLLALCLCGASMAGNETASPTAAPVQSCRDAITDLQQLSFLNNQKLSAFMLETSGIDLDAMGDFERCNKVCTRAEADCPFPDTVQHCVIVVNPADIQGLCLPGAHFCSTEEIAEIVPEVLGNLFHLNGSVTPQTVQCGGHEAGDLSAGSIAMTAIMGVLLALVIFGTMMDVSKPVVRTEFNQGMNAGLSPMLTTPLRGDSDANASDELLTPGPPAGCLKRVLLAFSLKSSLQTLLTRSATRKYKALDGIRSISLLWIILAHTSNFMSLIGFTNPYEFFPQGGSNALTCRWTFFVFVYAANFGVDTFFFLSAFLATLVMGRRLQRGQKVPVLGAVLHRFIRLTPNYLFAIFFFYLIMDHLGSGPFWYQMNELTSKCGTYWWTNIFYVNNFYPKYTDQCLPWTWYLANDMQFFVVGTILVVLFHWRPKLTWVVLPFLILASIGTTVALAVQYKLKMVDLVHPEDMQNITYDKPYCRIPAYLIGMLTAMLFTQTEFRVRGTSAKAFCWVIVFVCTFTPAFVLYTDTCPPLIVNGAFQSKWTEVGDVLYMSLARPMWTIGVAVLTFLCITEEGGVADKVLSWWIWDPVAKLTYSAYLVHPMIMRLVYFNRNSLITYTDTFYAMHYLGFVALSYAVATVMFCVIETPFTKLEKLVGSLLSGKSAKSTNRM